jgi:hypothetical protein
MSAPDRAARDWWDPRSLANSARGVATGVLKPVAGGAANAVSAGVDVVSAGVDAAPRIGASALRSTRLDGPGLLGRLERVLDSEQAAAVATVVARSAAFDELLRQMAANEGLWALIDVIAGSPAVREAVAQQGVGLADEVGYVVRSRARSVDDRIERITRLVGRRRSRPAGAEPHPGPQ